MAKVIVRTLTRANVLLLGLIVLALGGIGYAFFLFLGFESVNAGIASEAVLISLVGIWVLTYIFRVFTGRMTFNEQRKRYINAYEQKTAEELESRFELLTDEEKNDLLKGLDSGD